VSLAVAGALAWLGATRSAGAQPAYQVKDLNPAIAAANSNPYYFVDLTASP
jgi:hypothetical protein